MATASRVVLTGQLAGDKPGAAKPAAPASPAIQESAFAHLLKIESDARRAMSTRELDALYTSESRKLLRARQVFVVEYDKNGGRVTAMTGVSIVDRSTPIVIWIEAMIRQMAREEGLGKLIELELPGYADPSDALTKEYPFRFILWQPMWSPNSVVSVGSLFMREKPWIEADHRIAARLGETFGHARTLLCSSNSLRRRFRIKSKHLLAAVGVAFLLSAIPVPISVLAPVEVVPRNADVVSMPVEGIVQKVLVSPNAKVQKGTPLVQLLDTLERNKAEVALREVAVAKARVEQATILAFSDPKGRQELGLANAEYALKVAQERYARDLLEQTLIVAEAPGVTVFSDPKEIEGKPLGLGERLMLIAREGESELRVSLPVADSIVLKPGLKVRAFLDSDPLNPVEADVAHVDYQVRVDEQQTASYRVTARIQGDTSRLTFGSRGTAQIKGERAPLFVYLFRRPLTYLRQRLGL